jgi:hypothetical protein
MLPDAGPAVWWHTTVLTARNEPWPRDFQPVLLGHLEPGLAGNVGEVGQVAGGHRFTLLSSTGRHRKWWSEPGTLTTVVRPTGLTVDALAGDDDHAVDAAVDEQLNWPLPNERSRH